MKTVLITGGGGGIGGGMGEAFAESGYRVVLADIEVDLAEAKAKEIGGSAVALDVTSLESWSAVKAQIGAVDVLCNNAGISTPFQSLPGTDPELFARVMAAPLIPPPPLRGRDQGRGVRVASAAQETHARREFLLDGRRRPHPLPNPSPVKGEGLL